MANKNRKERIDYDAWRLDQAVLQHVADQAPVRLQRLTRVMLADPKVKFLFRSAAQRYRNRGGVVPRLEPDAVVRRSLTRLLRAGKVVADRSRAWFLTKEIP